MNFRVKIAAALLVVTSVTSAALAWWRRERRLPPIEETNAVPLWANGAPGSFARQDEREIAGPWYVRNVHHPSLTPFLPAPHKANGTAVVVLPGGGFSTLVFGSEGVEPSEWLRDRGVAAFALKYRLPADEGSPYSREDAKRDVERALRLVRSRAAEWKLDVRRVGVLGFSAGGELASNVAHSATAADPQAADVIDRERATPDFQVLVYPAGGVPNRVAPEAPPAFLIVAKDDEYGCASVTRALAEKLEAAGVPVAAHFLSEGKHGFHLGRDSPFPAVRAWPELLSAWLGARGYLTRSHEIR
jgi:acetyl esterase/lipase